MHVLAHEYTSRNISPWGGIKLFQQTYAHSGLRDDLLAVELPRGKSNSAYNAVDLVEGFLVSTLLGARRTSHVGMLRTDEVVREIFGWKRGVGDPSTYSRFFRKFSIEGNDLLFTELMRRWWSRMEVRKLTIDVDSTVITRYGHQEGAEVGYNPAKHGRASHHPLMAFCEELQMVVNGWMRPGNTNAATDADHFLAQLLLIVPPERIGLLRGDIGFYGEPFMRALEADKVPYIIRGRMTSALLSKVVSIRNWNHDSTVFPDAQYAEFTYKAKGWSKARRAIAVRRPKKGKVAAPALFEEEVMHKEYAISVYFTSKDDLSASKVHLLYNQRGDCENRIKELKYDYGIDGFSFKDIGAVEAAFRFVLLAFNIMALFKQKVMTTSKVRHQLSTIRFQCIAIGSYLVKRGRSTVLKLSAEGHRRHFLEHFFDQVEILKPPFKFSTA
jgi:hypothetical protein